jgi:hypothetical protein
MTMQFTPRRGFGAWQERNQHPVNNLGCNLAKIYLWFPLTNIYEIYRFLIGFAQTTATNQWGDQRQHRITDPGRFSF